jgi:hypothetical protein
MSMGSRIRLASDIGICKGKVMRSLYSTFILVESYFFEFEPVEHRLHSCQNVVIGISRQKNSTHGEDPVEDPLSSANMRSMSEAICVRCKAQVARSWRLRVSRSS